MIEHKNTKQFYRILHFLANHEQIIQSAWENWNGLRWEEEFSEEDLKEGDCIILPDYSIQFIESGWGDFYAQQHGGWLLYEQKQVDLDDLQFFIKDHLDILQKSGHVPEDNLGDPPLN